MPKFIHADNCALYAQDAQECAEPWLRWQFLVGGAVWSDANGPFAFKPDGQYRRKPRTILINGYEVPEPVREPLKEGEPYWLADTGAMMMMCRFWCNDQCDQKRLAAGLIHLSNEAAQIHIDALLSFTRRGE